MGHVEEDDDEGVAATEERFDFHVAAESQRTFTTKNTEHTEAAGLPCIFNFSAASVISVVKN